MPVGTIGELLVRGPGVTVGYYDREDATAGIIPARFVVQNGGHGPN